MTNYLRLAKEVVFFAIFVAFLATYVVGTELHNVFSVLVTFALIVNSIAWFRHHQVAKKG